MDKMQRIDGRNILPELLKNSAVVGPSIIDDITLAASNKLRQFLEIPSNALMKGPMKKCVTRKDPTLDNYCADLFLRTCYEPSPDVPVFEEHLIRDLEDVLSSELNPRLFDAILIGIGGQSKNPDFAAVYDEHDKDGKRVLRSATEVVYNRHLKEASAEGKLGEIWPIIEIISKIDSKGGSSYDALNSFTKNLHYAQFKQPGFVVENLAVQWKRAILESILVSLLVNAKELKAADVDTMRSIADEEIQNYVLKRGALIEKGFLENNSKNANRSVEYIKQKLLGPTEKNYLTFKEICFALKKTWDSKICSFLASFILESVIQLQQEYYNFEDKKLNEIELGKRYSIIFYEMEPQDMFPNRPILSKLNNEKKRGLLVLYNPFVQITSIFHNNFFVLEVWKKFVDIIKEKEPDRWYTPTDDKGHYASFLLNGTRSFVGLKMTDLTENDYISIIKSIY